MTDPAAGATPRIQILHVEDEPLNRELLRAILDRAPDARLRSAQIDEAADLGAARSLMTTNPPDLVLLDVRLPDGNGLDFLREVRSHEPSPRVVVMSASVLAVERDEAIRAGCDAFLGKPYTRAELTAMLQQVLFAEAGDQDGNDVGDLGPRGSS
jgi:two-component system KDP operon response regulator KdpE